MSTASGDDVEYVAWFERAFEGRDRTSVLSLFCRRPWGDTDPSMVLERDVIHVGGGSTANLLAVWRLHGLPDILAQAAENGVVLAGVSAGVNTWFEGSSTDSFVPLAPLRDGRGMLPGSACPHYVGEETGSGPVAGWRPKAAPGRTRRRRRGRAGLARGELAEAVGERPGGRAFRVTRHGGRAVETPLDVRYLG